MATQEKTHPRFEGVFMSLPSTVDDEEIKGIIIARRVGGGS
jgi:hypothetical protein